MTQTATTITVDSLPIANSIDPVQDRVLIYTASATDIQGISRNVLLGLSSQPLGLTDSQSPQNKTFDNTNSLTIKAANLVIQDGADTTKQAKFIASGITTGNSRNYTLPDYNATLASLAGVETFTNKTLTSPVTTALSNTGGLTTNSINVTGAATVGTTLGVTGATTLTASLSVGTTLGVTGAATLASLILNGSLTGTGLASQVQTFNNTGSAGGTFFYINLGGIKFLWGFTANISQAGSTQTSFNVTLPVGFFSSIQTAVESIFNASYSFNLTQGINSASTTTIAIEFANNNNSAVTSNAYLFVVGT